MDCDNTLRNVTVVMWNTKDARGECVWDRNLPDFFLLTHPRQCGPSDNRACSCMGLISQPFWRRCFLHESHYLSPYSVFLNWCLGVLLLLTHIYSQTLPSPSSSGVHSLVFCRNWVLSPKMLLCDFLLCHGNTVVKIFCMLAWMEWITEYDTYAVWFPGGEKIYLLKLCMARVNLAFVL